MLRFIDERLVISRSRGSQKASLAKDQRSSYVRFVDLRKTYRTRRYNATLPHVSFQRLGLLKLTRQQSELSSDHREDRDLKWLT